MNMDSTILLLSMLAYINFLGLPIIFTIIFTVTTYKASTPIKSKGVQSTCSQHTCTHTTQAMGHWHAMEAMGHGQLHVMEAMGHGQAMDYGHVMEAMGHEHVIEAKEHGHVMDMGMLWRPWDMGM